MQAQTIERATYSVDETSKVLGLGRNTTYEAVRTGAIGSIKIGGRILIPRTEVERILTGGVNSK